MNWKKTLNELIKNENWEAALTFTRNAIAENSNDVELIIQGIYLCHTLLLEVICDSLDLEKVESDLQKYFRLGNSKFFDYPEYLFFVGRLLFIGEWLFGVNDDFKPMEERLAFQMEKKAHQLEPNNVLYKWGYIFLIDVKLASSIAKGIITD